ncbi:MAG: hypothetical protein H3C47_11980 [Candidatus Cloacimonetes bacterium]|nr:hypothetical protein [Candidatus Cloacimonadota bacterium]
MSTQLPDKPRWVYRFEYTWELSWKLIKDYLSHEGLVLYNIKKFEEVIQQIHEHYLQIFDELHVSMLERVVQESGA